MQIVCNLVFSYYLVSIKLITMANTNKESTFKTLSVTAQSFNRRTGKPDCEPRKETIDTDNKLFNNCETVIDIHGVYESFWNNMNRDSESIVFVHSIDVEWS